jgi:hypothetical protein
VEQPEWKRVRNRVMRSAEFALLSLIPALEGNMKMDWAAGVIYSIPRGVPSGDLMGSYHRATETWAWEKKVLTVSPYNLTVEGLETARALSMSTDDS